MTYNTYGFILNAIAIDRPKGQQHPPSSLLAHNYPILEDTDARIYLTTGHMLQPLTYTRSSNNVLLGIIRNMQFN